MAQIPSSPTTASIFMGAPITYRVKPAAESPSERDAISFHRVKLKVRVTATGGIAADFELSQPVSGTSDLDFDVSSCFRAAADLYEYQPVTAGTVTYPSFTANIEARDVWVNDGQLVDPAPGNGAVTTAQYTALMGTLTDYERRRGIVTPLATRKPLDGELVCVGDKICRPTINGLTAQSDVQTVSADQQGRTIAVGSTHHAYVLPATRRGAQFQFVNARGCIESVRAFALTAEKEKGSNERITTSRFETLTQFSRSYTRKRPQPQELSFSSGFVSYRWARWWADEFCQSSQHWMLVDGAWLPVHITLSDSTTIIDRSKAPTLCNVDFTVTPDANGGLW